MKVEALNVGWISSPAAVYRQGEDPSVRIRFPVPAYLIETDSERILIDAGLHPGAVADPAAFYGPAAGMFELEQEQSVAELLDMDTLTRIVLTHLHFDHAGALSLLPPSVPLVIQRREWEAAHDRAAVKRNFFYPRDYAAAEDRELVLVDGDHDLLGDGSVELLLTPGHTPGHQSVRVGEKLVIGADVGHFAVTLDDHRFPSFADDFAAQAGSAERLRALRDTGVRVLPGHDPDILRPGPVA
jgi:glyoxylase-like metal-dependent hydrolase (beta-lactamase superfamily II)